LSADVRGRRKLPLVELVLLPVVLPVLLLALRRNSENGGALEHCDASLPSS
jgi:hypothetical protein